MDMEDLDHLDRDHQVDQLRKEQRERDGDSSTVPLPGLMGTGHRYLCAFRSTGGGRPCNCDLGTGTGVDDGSIDPLTALARIFGEEA